MHARLLYIIQFEMFSFFYYYYYFSIQMNVNVKTYVPMRGYADKFMNWIFL